ncbi:unnamed protein product [Bursaphelenchus xylophilus]|uniref:(pine wood nematode) hypothetical protein n=1 Tax=Bursaphelenchus xylophilus TaxID=6326 RepID=A0A1I7RWR1_BURXY|nr:unnamed protein product [Bursaphelenchus xylophilus]CAG9128594.1 unnamed protein product [Bursaphelenchus xylophilus]
MGLKGLYKSFVKNYNGLQTLVEVGSGPDGPEIDNLFLNMNVFMLNIIHAMDVSNAKPERKMLNVCLTELDRFVEKMRPKKLLYLSFSGILPQQDLVRRRPKRLVRGAEREDVINRIKKAREMLEEEGYTVPQRLVEVFDTNAVHFGTEFMEKITAAVYNHISLRLDKEWSSLMVLVSDHTVPGSASVKIMDYIRSQNYKDDVSSAAFLPENSSLIEILSLKLKKFYAIRRKVRTDPCDVCQSLDHTTVNCNAGLAKKNLGIKRAVHVDVYSIIDLAELKKRILIDHSVGLDNPKPVIPDYVFLASFYASEPSYPCPFYFAAKLHIEALFEFNLRLTKDGVPLPKNVKDYFGVMNSIQNFRYGFLKCQQMEEGPAEYYNRLYGRFDMEFRKKLTERFFETVYWTHEYMTKGSDVDWEYCNTDEHPPHLVDLAEFAPTTLPTFKKYPPRANIFEQLFASIPQRSYQLLPKQWHKLMTDLDPKIEHLFPQIDLKKTSSWGAQGVIIDDLKGLRKFLTENYHLLPESYIRRCRRGEVSIFVHESHPLCQFIERATKTHPKGPKQKYWYKASVKKHSLRGLVLPVTDSAIHGQMSLSLNQIDLSVKENMEKLKELTNLRI